MCWVWSWSLKICCGSSCLAVASLQMHIMYTTAVQWNVCRPFTKEMGCRMYINLREGRTAVAHHNSVHEWLTSWRYGLCYQRWAVKWKMMLWYSRRHPLSFAISTFGHTESNHATRICVSITMDLLNEGPKWAIKSWICLILLFKCSCYCWQINIFTDVAASE